MQSRWDAAGRRTRTTWPDSNYVEYDYDQAGAMTGVRQNGATSGLYVLATYGYDELGRRASLARGNGTTTAYGYTGPWLSSLAHHFASSADDVAFTYTYNAAGQIHTRTASNNAYAFTGMGSGTLDYGTNGLNQVSAVGATQVQSDQRGNLLSDGQNSYTFSSENRVISLTTAPWAPAALSYDPLGRWTKGSTNLWLLWDGDDMTVEKISSYATRWVHGAGSEPLAREDTDGTLHFMHADERGSVIGSSTNDGTSDLKTAYDEYGRGGTGFRYAYAGEVVIGGGINYFHNRAYSRNLGRFLQTDPIGYGAGMNMYAYVGADPINHVDPSGLTQQDPIDVVHPHLQDGFPGGAVNVGGAVGSSDNGRDRSDGGCDPNDDHCDTVTATRPKNPTPKLPYAPQVFMPYAWAEGVTYRGVCPSTSGVRSPDFFSFSASSPIPNPVTAVFAGLGASLTMDRYGNDYFSLNGVGGFPTAGGGSLMGGWVNSRQMPSQSHLSDILGGWGGGMTVANWLGATAYGNASGSTTSVGLSTPGVSVHGGYTWNLGSYTAVWCS